jgi:hypothetical protein
MTSKSTHGPKANALLQKLPPQESILPHQAQVSSAIFVHRGCSTQSMTATSVSALYSCHILDHEGRGMMANISTVPGANALRGRSRSNFMSN